MYCVLNEVVHKEKQRNTPRQQPKKKNEAAAQKRVACRQGAYSWQSRLRTWNKEAIFLAASAYDIICVPYTDILCKVSEPV